MCGVWVWVLSFVLSLGESVEARPHETTNIAAHLMKQLNVFFESIVEVPRIRIGGKQTIETLIACMR